jgi:hypothetical protein
VVRKWGQRGVEGELGSDDMDEDGQDDAMKGWTIDDT